MFFLLHSSLSYFALLHHRDWKANCFWVTWWSVTISERSGSCPSITRRQNRSFSNLSMIRTESMLIVINDKKEKNINFLPPQRGCCVCVNEFTFCVNQNAFRAKCMKRLCMWIKFMPATFAAMFLSPGFQAGGKSWKIKTQK